MSTLDDKVAAIKGLRFPEARMVGQMIKGCQLDGAIVSQDERGYFAEGFDTLPAWLAAMPTNADLGAMPQPDAPAPRPQGAPSGRKREGGACDIIRTWTREHPDATAADAVAALPDFNPSTVKIQFRKARQGA